jgi:hypothetical protein
MGNPHFDVQWPFFQPAYDRQYSKVAKSSLKSCFQYPYAQYFFDFKYNVFFFTSFLTDRPMLIKSMKVRTLMRLEHSCSPKIMYLLG